jgi:hypothetical protein
VQHGGAVDVVHLKHIAEQRRPGQHVRLGAPPDLRHLALTRARDTAEPIEQMQPSSCPDILRHISRQMLCKPLR